MVEVMNNEIAEKILTEIDAKKDRGATIASIGFKAGMARNTFSRRLNGGGEDFTAYEIARIAIALEIDPNALLPKVFKVKREHAE